jgi:hypothetical protein
MQPHLFSADYPQTLPWAKSKQITAKARRREEMQREDPQMAQVFADPDWNPPPSCGSSLFCSSFSSRLRSVSETDFVL